MQDLAIVCLESFVLLSSLLYDTGGVALPGTGSIDELTLPLDKRQAQPHHAGITTWRQ